MKDQKYTVKQINEAIAYWKGMLESMKDEEKKLKEAESVKNEQIREKEEDTAEPKKTFKQKIKEAIAPVGAAASIAKSVATCADHLPEIIAVARDLITAINRGAEAVERAVAQRESRK